MHCRQIFASPKSCSQHSLPGPWGHPIAMRSAFPWGSRRAMAGRKTLRIPFAPGGQSPDAGETLSQFSQKRSAASTSCINLSELAQGDSRPAGDGGIAQFARPCIEVSEASQELAGLLQGVYGFKFGSRATTMAARMVMICNGRMVHDLYPGIPVSVRQPGAVSEIPIRGGAAENFRGVKRIGKASHNQLLGLENITRVHRWGEKSSWGAWGGAAVRSSSVPLAPIDLNPKREEGVVCLVLGSGGREHSLCYGLRRSASCAGVFCAPGNAGISSSGDATCVSTLNISDSAAVASFCKEWGVALVVVGPEGPLVSGLVDDLLDAGIPTFGPSEAASALEGSKTFMKRLCDKYRIPTAQYGSFTNAEEAKNYIKEQELPIVVKADGLAAGKGVIIANTLEEAFEAVDSMLVEGTFGSAGGLVVVEEFLDGEEVSFFAIVDGETAVPLASAQDHKRVGDGDTGLNTGGMGAYSPAPVLTPEIESLVMDSIILPTVKGMAAEGCRFVGVLYAGIIVESKNGLPKLLEYNVRFGDPECQVLMLRFKSDLVQVLLAACQGQLKGIELEWSEDPALVVVMASKGYPGNYKKNTIIKNLDEAESFGKQVKVFHAGTALDSQQNMVAVGGRVLGVTAMGKDIAEAQRKAYQVVDCINWPEGFCRRDIGWRAVARLNTDELNVTEDTQTTTLFH